MSVERPRPDALGSCRRAIGRSLVPIAVTQGDAHVVRLANDSFCRLAGADLAGVLGRPFAEVAPRGARKICASVLDHVQGTGEPSAIDRGPPVAGDDDTWWSCAAWPVLDEEDRPAAVMIEVRDATEASRLARLQAKAGQDLRDLSQQLLLSRIRMDELAELAATAEEQLLQAKKMEGIGRLAGGVAHDFNNLLTAILGYAELAEESLADGASAGPCLEAIKKAAGRAATLTSQLLALGRKQIVHPKVIDLNAWVADMESMLRRLTGDSVDLVFVPEPDLGAVLIDPSQLGHVLMDLVANARDAMPDGGTIRIETANVTLDELAAGRLGAVGAGAHVQLTVADTGLGMTPEVLARIFEPFFTTKGRGVGTGMGLATCYGIVKQGGGHIRAVSAPGAGTTVTVLLPRVEAPEPAFEPGTAIAAPRRTGVIVLVEDEAMVREIAARALRREGYAVLEAANGDEALRLFRERPEEIDLLLTDVIMPRMGGEQLVARLRATHPRLRVLYMSGYTGGAIVRDGVLPPGLAFVPKPFTPAALAQAVRDVLEGAAGAD